MRERRADFMRRPARQSNQRDALLCKERVRGLPDRGRSASPAKPFSKYRSHQRRTFMRSIISRRAISRTGTPPARHSTICARCTCRYSALARRTIDSNSSRCSVDSRITRVVGSRLEALEIFILSLDHTWSTGAKFLTGSTSESAQTTNVQKEESPSGEAPTKLQQHIAEGERAIS